MPAQRTLKLNPQPKPHATPEEAVVYTKRQAIEAAIRNSEREIGRHARHILQLNKALAMLNLQEAGVAARVSGTMDRLVISEIL